MTRMNKKISQVFLLAFLAIFLIGSISVPVVTADVADVEDETLDMDAPVETAEEVPAAVEEEAIEAKESEVEEDEEEVQSETDDEPGEDEEEEEEKEEETQVEESSTEGIESTEVAESNNPIAPLVAPLLEKVKSLKNISKQDAKKIAAFGLGAWGAVTGVGWAMHKIGGDSD